MSGLYSWVRTYGIDCDQVATVMPAANSINVGLFLGLFNLGTLSGDVESMAQSVQANGGWSNIEAVSVGNELVNNGQVTPDQMIAAVKATRQSLRNAGFSGPVVTVDTFTAVLAHPELCDASDFCAMNVHPFFDPNTPAGSAGEFVSAQVQNVRQKLSDANKRVVVTESGWPKQGDANGLAVPGMDNQRAALASIRAVYGVQNMKDLILFSAFDAMWKKAEASTFFAEQYWGI